jgi:hypothetical protein
VSKRSKCALCGKTVDDGSLCYGCKEYVCDDCDPGLETPLGKHSLDVHREIKERSER